VVNRVRSTTARPPRVYTIPVALLLAALALTAGRGLAQAPVVDLSVEPSMVKGPRTAPVTIVEFSDYQ
jgi:hypothetical protein